MFYSFLLISFFMLALLAYRCIGNMRVSSSMHCITLLPQLLQTICYHLKNAQTCRRSQIYEQPDTLILKCPWLNWNRVLTLKHSNTFITIEGIKNRWMQFSYISGTWTIFQDAVGTTGNFSAQAQRRIPKLTIRTGLSTFSAGSKTWPSLRDTN